MFFFVFLFISSHFLIALISDKILPYQGFFAYPETLKNYHLPKFIYSFANFDGVYYLKIAQSGYQQFEQAFFPLFPLLIRFLTLITKNYLISAFIIVYFCFFLSLFLLKKLIKNYQSIIIFLLIFPTSFYFVSVYTESVFLLFLILFFYFFKQKKYFLASIFGFFSSLTRINGVLLIIPFIIKIIENLKNKKINLSLIFYPLITIFGTIVYMIYLKITTGDFLTFLKAQPAFGANRSTNLISLPQVYFRYFKILITAKLNYQYFVAFFEILIFTFTFLILLFDIKNIVNKKTEKQFFLSLNLFSIANLILPTLTGTFSSIPRYSLMSLSQFIFFSQIKNNFFKLSLGLLFLILHFVFFVFYLQGYFIS